MTPRTSAIPCGATRAPVTGVRPERAWRAVRPGSTSVPAILVRFGFYLVQVGILLKWSFGLLLGV